MNISTAEESSRQLADMQNIDIQSVLELFETSGERLSQPFMIGTILAIVIFALWCFFGLKLIRVWAAVFGLLIGCALGMGAAMAFGLEGTVVWIIGLAAGIILACLGAGIYHLGIFLIAWIVGISVSSWLIRPQDWIFTLVCVGIGLAAALLTLKFAAPVTIVITAVFGAMRLGICIPRLLPLDIPFLKLGITVVFAVLGILVQFLMESGRRKKQHLKKAGEIRARNSTEQEVERARSFIDDIDD